MKIGIISDTHDHLRFLAQAIENMNQMELDLVIHCGDWTCPFTMRCFSKLNCPIKSVLGNGDPDIEKFKYQLGSLEILKNVKIDFEILMHDFIVDGLRFGVTHGHDENLKKVLIESQLFDVLCWGHTHQLEIKKEGKTTIINPGSLVGYFAEEGKRPITFAVFETETKEVRIINLEE